MNTNKEKINAFHEAGHSVLAALYGRCIRADIIPIVTDDDVRIGGRTWINYPEHCVRHVAVLLAGSMAAWEYQWRENQPMDYGPYGDLEKIDELLRLWYRNELVIPPREECAEYFEAEELARQELANNWGAVESIASYLLKYKKIAGETVHAIVARHQSLAKQVGAENGHSIK